MYENASAFISTSIELLDKETMTVTKLSLDELNDVFTYDDEHCDDILECDEFFEFNEQYLNRFVPKNDFYTIH